MNIEEADNLFLQIDGPKLSAYRHIYAVQFRNNCLQFGASRNKYGAKKIEISDDENGYNIKFIYYKADYKNFEAPVKQIKHEETNLNVSQLKEIVSGAFS